MDTVTRTTVHGRGAVWIGLVPLGIAVYVASVAGHKDFRAPAAVGYAIAWLFGAVGLSFVAHGVRGAFAARRRARQLDERPDEPWLADHPWDARGADDEPWRRVFEGVWGPLLLVGFAVPANWFGFGPQGSWIPVLFAVILDLVLLTTVVYALRRLAQALRYGGSRLGYERFPFRPGAPLAVRFSASFDLQAVPSIRAALRYVEERVEVSGSGRNRSTRIVRDVSREQAQVLDDPRQEMRIAFDLPADAPSTELSARPARYWELALSAEAAGADFETRFLVPVYGAAPAPQPLVPA